MNRNRKLILGIGVVLAAAGGGVALGASDNSPGEENQAVLNDAAEQLGISPTKLSDALKKALSDRVDAAVAAGRITKAEGDALKQRINSDDFPLFGGFHRGFGHFGFFGKLDAAADYLGLSEAELRTQLENGKSLAQVAQAQGKSVDGLVDALVAEAKKHLDEAVAAGRLTKSQETEMLDGLRDRITHLVNATPPAGGRFLHPPHGFGFRHFGRPPS
jgi:AraC-like DNA-binding protein